MKLFREVVIIFGLYYIGEIISKGCSLPLPGSLVGMILLLVLLRFRVVSMEQISTVSDFLLGHLPFFFIPAGVALLAIFPMIAKTWWLMILLCAITTFITMGVCGWSIQKLIERDNVHE